MKAKGVAQLKKSADKYFSQYIRLRDSDQNGIAECITCDTRVHWKRIQCGHFVSRKASTLRFDEENCNAQCVGCNMFKQGEQYLYSKAIDLKYGDGKAEELMNRRFETHKFTIPELEEIISDSQQQIKFYLEHIKGE